METVDTYITKYSYCKYYLEEYCYAIFVTVAGYLNLTSLWITRLSMHCMTNVIWEGLLELLEDPDCTCTDIAEELRCSQSTHIKF